MCRDFRSVNLSAVHCKKLVFSDAFICTLWLSKYITIF